MRLGLVVDRAQAEGLAAFFEEVGAVAVSLRAGSDEDIIEDGDEPPPLWAETEVIALLDEAPGIEAVLAGLLARFTPMPAYRLTRLDDQDWGESWKTHITPLCFGGRLWVHPSWWRPPDGQIACIVLDPGMAFGTGHHPSTALCLNWLVHAGSLTGREVIDYGCGSGILALAAARLGAAPVWAVDCDPRALEVSRANASINGLETAVIAATPERLPPRSAAVLLANILLRPLAALAPRFADLVAPGGVAVLSGLVESQVEQCLEAYDPWFTIECVEHLDGWALVQTTRRT
jgi:ribosomal protein L11 methyltransferase